MTALRALRHGKVQKGQHVLIYGASGAVGTYAVQLARHFGAEVTGVCSTRNLELIRALGAATAIDYTQEDYTKRGETYDVVIDAVGMLASEQAQQVLRPSGLYVNVHNVPGSESLDDLVLLKELAEAAIVRPVIDCKVTRINIHTSSDVKQLSKGFVQLDNKWCIVLLVCVR